MKLNINKRHLLLSFTMCLLCFLFGFQETVNAQDSTGAATVKPAPAKVKPVKNTFESLWIIDNQTVMVPQKGTFEMEIMHRFGTTENGYDDFWGLFAPSNIRLGASYSPINNLFIGIGITKSNMLWDASAKYALMKQTKGQYPVSITYYGNMGYDTRKDPDGSLFKYNSQRLIFFNQLIIARKVTDKFSIQVAPSVSHQNAVNGYYTKNDSTGTSTYKEMEFNHFAIAISGRYKLTNVTSVMVNYDQPLTKHNQNNPNPNLSFGFEFSTSSHSFQIFAGSYGLLSPQRNNLYNDTNPFGSYTDAAGNKHEGHQFRIGFNITRLWNY
ncbi:DUF5777 family beta-barrel protein [Flavihumibacter profundi]|uniref:DUF5777 family beta-barrel protein n=1 Tax=Flavihumibacter profundi TaxID=2716883 RepID=UPI001CC33712|nr:DUF5777 family beta-barrel protein [Flavihumibacter profundi]MBZ5858833.1 DUF5777 family beta-barrel protein [Flavihumibacter profundi]